MVKCDYTSEVKGEKFCEFKISDLGSKCSERNKFGYEAGYPCIVVKLNKIFDWEPVLYNTTDELPDKMPKDVRDKIAADFTEPGSNNVREGETGTADVRDVVGEGQGRGVR